MSGDFSGHPSSGSQNSLFASHEFPQLGRRNVPVSRSTCCDHFETCTVPSADKKKFPVLREFAAADLRGTAPPPAPGAVPFPAIAAFHVS